MNTLFGPEQAALQRLFDSEALAQRVSDAIVTDQISPAHQAFIESRDMFFLSSVGHRGYPTCSYKGGNTGLVKVLDNTTLAFPSYDGNSMYLSMGNINANHKVGMLFIDLETPHRVRVHGDASIVMDDPLLAQYPEAELMVRVHIVEIFVNCPRYIHQYQRIQSSRYVPQMHCATPLPQWKRIDGLQDALPERDRAIAQQLGGVIDSDTYEQMVRQGKA